MEIHPSKNYNLERLQRWLDYELSSSALLLFSWFWGLLLGIMLIAAIIFTPFMLKVLFDEKKYGWLIYFFILVIIPASAIFLINIDLSYRFMLGYVPVGLFYLYCFHLKLAVRGWMVDEKFISMENTSPINTDDVFKNYKF